MEIAPRAPLDEARADDTNTERLRELANRALAMPATRPERAPLLEAVVANPNTPADLLAELAPQFWAVFFRNPAGPLLPLEVPDLLDRWGEGRLRPLLRLTGVPEWLLRWLAGSSARAPQLALEARLHVAGAGEAGREWEPRLRRALRRAADVATLEEREAHAELAELGLAPEWAAVAGAEDRGGAPAPLAEPGTLPAALAEIAAAILEAPAPLGEVRRIATTQLPELTALVGHPATPVRLLGLIADTARLGGVRRAWIPEEVRHAAAANPASGRSLLALLCEDPSPRVRRAARRHPKAPADAAERCRTAALATPADAPLCRLVALLHPSAPPKKLEAAADSPFWTERLAAALRGREGLTRLAQDGNAFVRAVARARGPNGANRIDFRLE